MKRRDFLSSLLLTLTACVSGTFRWPKPPEPLDSLKNQPSGELDELIRHDRVQADIEAALGSPEDQVWAKVQRDVFDIHPEDWESRRVVWDE